MMELKKYSLGTGDRFGQQGVPQLKAILEAGDAGIEITPVWNKSHREHKITNTHPESTRDEADEAVRSLGYTGPYFVDADHITRETFAEFASCSDYFTIDVAGQIGNEPAEEESLDFVEKFQSWSPDPSINISSDFLKNFADNYLKAIMEAKEIFEAIKESKGAGNFIAELSIDEVTGSQTPVELYCILAGLELFKVPVHAIAPKFPGRFNKGIDYRGDLDLFENEFRRYIRVVKAFSKRDLFPSGLKLSIHTGSDKFSLYPIMNRIIKEENTGLHLKTAGTTWLEELAGLAASGPESLKMVKMIYSQALSRFDELYEPYQQVVNIDPLNLPRDSEVQKWTGEKFITTLNNNEGKYDYNPDFRQILHLAYKIAAEHKDEYIDQLNNNREIISRFVKDNLLERHIKPLFGP